jgi:Predicted membrane protein (DUF2306)
MVIGVSALVMSFFMPRDRRRQSGSGHNILSLLFLIEMGKAYRHIRRREIEQHREWMIRAFSIALDVATIRPIVAIFFATSRFTRLTPYEFFGTAFCIGFVLHLIAAEVWIERTRSQRVKN